MLIRTLLALAVLVDVTAGPVVAQSATRMFEGVWTIGDESACGTQRYVIMEQAGELVFRDQSGKINVEAIVERGLDRLSTQTAVSNQVQSGTRWDYKGIGPTMILVRNASTGRTFNLVRCPGNSAPVLAEPEIDGAASLAFMQRYFTTWSGDNQTALAFINSRYLPNVLFYGKPTPRSTIMQQKESFVRRWPVRSYVLVPGTASTSCGGDACEITATVEWTCRSIERNAESSGVATFTLRLVGQGAGTMIAMENGGVTSRGLSRSSSNPPSPATWTLPPPPTPQPERLTNSPIPQIDVPPPRP